MKMHVKYTVYEKRKVGDTRTQTISSQQTQEMQWKRQIPLIGLEQGRGRTLGSAWHFFV